MSTMTEDGISPKHLRPYPTKVRELVMLLVNDLGVRHRIQDSNHMRLYSGDRSTEPFKIASSRPEEIQMRYLVKWATENVDGYPPETPIKAPAASEREDRPPVAPEPAGAARGEPQTVLTVEPLTAETGDWTPRSSADDRVREALAAKTEDGPTYEEAEVLTVVADPDGWVPYVNTSGESGKWEERDGTYRCTQCGTTVDKTTSMGGHYRAQHSNTGFGVAHMTDEQRRRSAETRARNAHKRNIAKALALLAEELDVEIPTDDKQQAEVAQLREELKQMEARAVAAEKDLAAINKVLGR